MDDLELRCPRCKLVFTDDQESQLADSVMAHLDQDHGHAPPREHVLARIERLNPSD